MAGHDIVVIGGHGLSAEGLLAAQAERQNRRVSGYGITISLTIQKTRKGT
jgi:hypothetical protein